MNGGASRGGTLSPSFPRGGSNRENCDSDDDDIPLVNKPHPSAIFQPSRQVVSLEGGNGASSPEGRRRESILVQPGNCSCLVLDPLVRRRDLPQRLSLPGHGTNICSDSGDLGDDRGLCPADSTLFRAKAGTPTRFSMNLNGAMRTVGGGSILHRASEAGYREDQVGELALDSIVTTSQQRSSSRASGRRVSHNGFLAAETSCPAYLNQHQPRRPSCSGSLSSVPVLPKIR